MCLLNVEKTKYWTYLFYTLRTTPIHDTQHKTINKKVYRGGGALFGFYFIMTPILSLSLKLKQCFAL